MVRKQFPSTRVIANVDNLGFGKTNNQAAKLAKGRYLCILNPDTVVSQNTRAVYRSLNQTNLGISGPQLTDGTGQFYGIQAGSSHVKAVSKSWAFSNCLRIYSGSTTT